MRGDANARGGGEKGELLSSASHSFTTHLLALAWLASLVLTWLAALAQIGKLAHRLHYK